jgi:hypothetical protein
MKTLPIIPRPRPAPRGGLLLHLGKYDRLIIRKVEFTCQECTPQGYVLARADNPLITETVTRVEMDEHRRDPAFRHASRQSHAAGGA